MSKVGNTRVPNEGPLEARIYIVGEAPGGDETELRRPFVGVSGTLLRECLSRNGILEEHVRFNNLCQFRPEDNKFPNVIGSKELEAGLEELAVNIRVYKPNVVVALGSWPLYYLTGKRGKKGGSGIIKWRGSILSCILPGCEGIKVIPTTHPAYVVRNRSDYPILDTDLKRVKYDSEFPELRLPDYSFTLNPTGNSLQECVDELLAAPYLSIDIESVKKSTHIMCVGYSPSPTRSIVIPFSDSNFDRLEAHHRLLTSGVPKVFHNGIFDIPMLKLNDIEVKNLVWDTMLAQHTMWPELPKALEYLCSVYTRQPYYKTEGRAEIPSDAKGWDTKFDRNALYRYNATDTAVTAAVYEAQQKEMAEGPEEWKGIFDFEMASLGVAQAISLEGMPIDTSYRDSLRRELRTRWAILQFILNGLTGYVTNVNSPKMMATILYDKDKMGLPVRKKRDGKVTTDEDAIVSLLGFVKDRLGKLKSGGSANQWWNVRYKVLQTVLEIRGIRKLLSSYVNTPTSEDGRTRSIYKVAATDTGRWAASKFYDGTGFNGQTMPREVLEIKDYAAIPGLEELMALVEKLEGEDNSEEAERDDADSTEADEAA